MQKGYTQVCIQCTFCEERSLCIFLYFTCRRTSLSSGRKIVYIGGVAYNATARRLSRRLSSGSSKRKLLAKSVVKKAGNRVWVAKCSTGEAADESFAHPGYEIRRKKGNRQWIAGNKSILARQANSIKHKYAACKSQLTSHPGKDKAKFLKVFIKNDIFIMDPSKRKLRRLSRTSLGCKVFLCYLLCQMY